MSETQYHTSYCNNLLNAVYNIRSGFNKMHMSHFYDRYELYYLFSGERYYFLKGQTFHIQAGDLVIMSPYTLDKTIDIGIPEHKRLAISFEEGYFSHIPPNLKKILFKPFVSDYCILRFKERNHEFADQLCQNIASELIQKNEGFELNLYALLIELLIFCARNMSSAESGSAISPSHSYSNIAKIVEYINTNFTQNITLSTLSKQFYLSPSYLSRTFKQTTGYSLIEYLNLVRINEAKKRLRKTDESVVQIAAEVGFINISTFNRVFKTATNMKPSEYRKYTKEKI